MAIFNYNNVSNVHDDHSVFLMIEDNPADAELFSEMLSIAFDGSESVVWVDRFEKVTSVIDNGNFDLLILDMELPDKSGVNNVHQLGLRYPDLPIVVLTGNEDLDLAINSLQNGAQDYLSKSSVTPEILARSIRYARERKSIEGKLKIALKDSDKKNIQLEALAKYDHLTGLANRAYFQDVANRILLSANRKKLKVALLYFDLNEFKKVNDTYGHCVGDELLKQVAERLKCVVRDSDFLARVGGDEFIIITETLSNKQEVYPLVKRIQEQFKVEFRIGEHRLHSNTSIGIAFYPDADNLDLLIKQADCAMYKAKENHNSSICFFSDQIASQYARSQKIESLLGWAIKQKENSTVFQPVLNVSDNDEIHLEALARWNSFQLGEVNPSEFITIAEKTPVINEITHSVTNDAYELHQIIQVNGKGINSISINVSANQLIDEIFCNQLIEWLNGLTLPSEHICLELTERQVVQNRTKCKEQMLFLKNYGIKFALDDFGSGFSSITHLLDLPFDYLKLDRILISYIDKSSRNQALVAGIVEMAHRLDMKVVAEGIEREQEKKMSVDLGCDYLQGYLISKPLPLHEAALYYEFQ